MNIAGLKLGFFLVLGTALGAAFFGALEWNVRLYCGSAQSRLAAPIHALRLFGVAAGLAGVARFGAAPLLCVAAGLQLARVFAVRAKASATEAVR